MRTRKAQLLKLVEERKRERHAIEQRLAERAAQHKRVQGIKGPELQIAQLEALLSAITDHVRALHSREACAS